MSHKRTRSSKTTLENLILIDEEVKERLVEKVHEMNQGEQEEPTEPDTKESTNETEIKANSVTNIEKEEYDKEPNSPKPVEGSANPKPKVEPEVETIKLSVEPKFTTPMPTST
ncbi:hypothetical protein J1N35_007590, partial [Gossypium stocksii]